ncbi:MAG TPA: replicative DNA helicase [Candidatus Dormibacteraeota bacterium]|nr:replicative DNA helicase [Candidatus Dormibacteraeota bacterium]
MVTAPQYEARVPPHDLDAEQSVLGAILLDPVAITKVLELLRPDDFYRENHRQIFRAAEELFSAGEPIDNITVSAALERMGVLERVGGRAHLAALEQSVPTAANVEYYARIVKDKSYKRRLISAGGEIASLGYQEGVEADEAVDRAQSTVFAIADDRTSTDFEKLDSLLRPTMDRLHLQMESGKGVTGVPSGFYDLDNITNGFKGSDLIIVAGRPSMGKTSLALNIGLNAALQHQIPVAIFSLEMSKEQLVERMLCEHAGIDAQRMHRGLLGGDEYDRLARALGPLGDAPIFIDDSAMMDELTIMLKARRVKQRENIGMVIIDYLQLMHGRRRGDDSNRVQEVSAISRALKGLARELKVPVLTISQLSRAPEQRPDKKPILSDLRESGSIEQDADLVIFVFRPDYYKSEDRPGLAEIIVAKNRNGPTDTITLRFRRELTRFENLARREQS